MPDGPDAKRLGHLPYRALLASPLLLSSLKFCITPIPLSGTSGAAFLATTVKPIAASVDPRKAIERFAEPAIGADLRARFCVCDATSDDVRCLQWFWRCNHEWWHRSKTDYRMGPNSISQSVGRLQGSSRRQSPPCSVRRALSARRSFAVAARRDSALAPRTARTGLRGPGVEPGFVGGQCS